MELEDVRYSTNRNGEFIDVPKMEDCLKAIRVRYEDAISRNKYLSKENEKLKSEHYENEEIKRLQNDLEIAREDLRRGFSITKEEKEKIDKFIKEHDEQVHGLNTLEKKVNAGGAIGGRYSYHFLPTSIGTIGTVKCVCGAEFTFCDL